MHIKVKILRYTSHTTCVLTELILIFLPYSVIEYTIAVVIVII